MTLLWTFLLGLMGVSAVIYCVTFLLRALDPRLEQWPALWAVSLLLCVLIPALALLWPVLPQELTITTSEIFPIHTSLDVMALTMLGQGETPHAGFGVVNALIKGVVGLYLLGVSWSLGKLIWGRSRIRKIIAQAENAEIAGQDDVLVSPEIDTPFAYTPFGARQRSKIVIPETYRGKVSHADLLNVLIHEREHLARRDDEVGLILRICLCLCWVSPFAHGLFGTWSQSTEMRCDMAVTRNRNPQMRKAYADILVQAFHIAAGRVRQYPAASFSTHRIRNEHMRIKNIMNGTQPSYKRRRDRLGLGVAAILLSVTGALTLSATANAGPEAKAKAKDVNWVSTDMVSGRLTAKFGESPDPFKKGETRNHYGVDIAAPIGTPIYAPMDGKVLAATDLFKGKPKYGNVVLFETENGIVTLFSHLDAYTVKTGQKVNKGDQLATIGNSGVSTGPHVHIETSKDGKRVNPQKVWNIWTK